MTLARNPQAARNAAIIEEVLVMGDLSKLTPEQRNQYYQAVCSSLGLNPLTKPFDFIVLNGKLTMYARKDCTDQLRKLHRVSIRITERSIMDDLMVVTAEATDSTGRTDCSIGAVSIAGLRGESKANALMKAETKARRRVTLAVCGLGILDETEVDSIPGARAPHHAVVDGTVNPRALPSTPVQAPMPAPAHAPDAAEAPKPAATPVPAVPESPGDSAYVDFEVQSIEEHKSRSGAPVWKVVASDGTVYACASDFLISDLNEIRTAGSVARCEVQKRGKSIIILAVDEVTS